MHLLAVMGLTLLASLSHARAASALTGDEQAKVLRGETIVKDVMIDGVRGIEASFFARAPRDEAFRILADTERLPAFMPTMKTCQVILRGEGYAVVKLIGEGGELTQRRSNQPPDRIAWTLIKGGLLRSMKGYWRLEPLNGGTLLSYGIAVEPTIPVPNSVVIHFQQQRLPPLVENVRARIESHGKWTKPGYAN
jgi:ribosome-associated toxin RatA of RatAB toxin-antitoxin module